MVVSQAPATSEKPLTLAIRGAANSSSDVSAPGTLLVSDLSLPDSPQTLAIMATSYQDPPNRTLEQLAVELVRDALVADSSQHASDLMRTGFRDANRAILEASPDLESGVSVLAMITRGKYATMALLGQDRAYLVRAGRLNQVTRDQRVVVARSRRKQDAEATATDSAAVRLLGESERLDAKSPAIFEIVLLPEDRLALFSHDLVELTGEDALRFRLQDSQIDGALGVVSSTTASGPAALMAAVLAAAPAREAMVIPPSATSAARPIWLIVIPVLLLLAVFVIAAYFVL